jgi:hypothetical protein
MVDQSLAAGATRTALRQLMEDSERAASERNYGVLKKNNRKARMQLLQEIHERMSRVALHNAFDAVLGYGGAVASIVLIAPKQDGAAIHHGVTIGVRGARRIEPLNGYSVGINAHALQRLNQRLTLLDVQGIRAVFKPASLLLMALAYSCAVNAKGVRQCSVPLFGGALRCDIYETGGLEVKTFVAAPAKWESGLVSELDDIYKALPSDTTSSLLWIPYALDAVGVKAKNDTFALEVLHSLGVISEKFAPAFQRHPWTNEIYMERPDPVGDVWTKAQETRQLDQPPY